MRDRCDYRAMSTRALLRVAQDDGLDAEMAIAIAERLNETIRLSFVGYHFNHSKEMTK